MIDINDFYLIDYVASNIRNKIETGLWPEAFIAYSYTLNVILEKTCNIDFYNILTKKKCISSLSLKDLLFFEDALYENIISTETQSLDNLMNGPVKKALGLNVTHGNQEPIVYVHLKDEILKPVINIVEQLLNETKLNVFVYNGQLDLITNTPGTLNWVEKLDWTQQWKWLPREPLLSKDGFLEGFSKTLDKFCMYWVNRAGHMVPRDNPIAMEIILKDLTSNA
ncbi:hypothetical protein ACFW04_007699 [Cataglyphis niger]